MSKRLLCLGLLAVMSQLFTTGCHPVARWRANHPCGACACSGIEAHRPIMHKYKAGDLPVGPVVATPQCHGCNGAPGGPVGLNGGPGDLMPITNPPTIGYPMPLSPGPMVVPSHELHQPMQMPKTGGN